MLTVELRRPAARGATVLSPAKLEANPVAYVPALMPERDTLFSVATPEPFVVGHVVPVDAPQTAVPLRLKVTVLPLTPEPAVRVAERLTAAAKAPAAGATARVVAVRVV